MTIKTEILDKWRALYAHGDYNKIADVYCTFNQRVAQKTARDFVREAFKFGVCRDNLYPIIESYYKKIEKQLRKTA